MKKWVRLFITSLIAFSYQTTNPDDHIFEPERLKKIIDTVTVIGTVKYINSEEDGDYHIKLKLDTSNIDSNKIVTTYFLKKNYTKQDSCLVIEIVCAEKSILTICKCNNYKNVIISPSIGDTVKVTGRLVYDKRHNWTEIHSVYKIEK